MQPSRSTGIPAPMLRTQGASANEPMDEPEPIFCQLRVLGRTVSLLKSTAVGLTAGLAVNLSVGLPVGDMILNRYERTPTIPGQTNWLSSGILISSHISITRTCFGCRSALSASVMA